MKSLIFFLVMAVGFSAVASECATTADTGTSTLVLVHVEDTLKISHVENFWDSLNYNRDTKKKYLGMASALNILAHTNPNFHFVYLTQDPDLVLGKIEREFVQKNGFPGGEFKTYNSTGGADLPIATLGSIIALGKYQRVIILGHNGGLDTKVFNQVAINFSNGVLVLPYVHIVYSTSSTTEVGNVLFPEQTGFVTSVELMLDWQQKGLVKAADALKFVTATSAQVINENTNATKDEYAVPSFVNCDDFQWKWDLGGELAFLSPFRDYLINRCHMEVPLAGFNL